MKALNETKPGYRPKIQHSEQDIYEKALKICLKYAEAKNLWKQFAFTIKSTTAPFGAG